MSNETSQRSASDGQRDSPTAAKETLSQEAPRVYEFGPFRLDPTERKLLRGNEIVVLTPKAFDTLVLLVRNSEHLLEKDEIIRMLWPDTFVEEGSLSNNIFLLRKALGEDQAFIETVPRRGYRFIGAVRQFPRAAPARIEESSEAGAPDSTSPVKARRPWLSRAGLWVAGVALVASLASAGWFYRRAGQTKGTIDSLAILPFVNANADPNTQYLSDGITESLINSLSQLPNLKVMSRDSVFRYKGKETDAQTVGRELGVRAIFKARIAQHGDAVNISAELINTRDSSHIWGQQYDRRIADMAVLREEIAREMASALRVRLTGVEEQRLVKNYTANPEAYQDYLKGRYWWNKSNKEGFDKGTEYFQQAVRKDPNYALAYSGLADCYSSLGESGLAPSRDSYLRAKDAALKALELDDTLAEAHSSLALIKSSYDWDWLGADKEIQRAIELNPGYTDAHRLRAEVLWQTGRLDEAISETRRTVELDPLSLDNNDTLGLEFFLARQYDQAIEQEGKVLELDPNYIEAYYLRGIAYLKKSMYVEGKADLEKGVTVAPASELALTGLGYGYAVTGRRIEAHRILDKLNELSKQKYVSPIWRVKIYAGLVEKDKAFEWLEKAYEDHSIVSVGYIKTNPMFDPLRSDPRYADLLRRTNLQP